MRRSPWQVDGTRSSCEGAGFLQGRRGALSDEDRCVETRNALAVIGITDVDILDFEDTQLWRHVTDMITAIEERASSTDWARVYTMFQYDRHQDHRAVYEASAVACRRARQLLGYETPSSYPNFTPTVFEPIGDMLETKVNALKQHKSQGGRLYMQEEKIRAAAHFRGAQIDLGPCEGFVPYKMIL